MTVSSLSVKNSYNGDNSTTSFAFTFPIHSSAELQVILRSSDGTETVQTLTTHYSIVDNGASGGQVNFVTAPATGITVVLLRNTNLTQETDYISNDPFPAETHEAALDKLTLQQQELQEEVDRSLKLSRTNTMNSTEFIVGATDRAGKILGFDNSGELSVTTTIGSNRGNWSASTTYAVRDIVKDTSTNNIFMANTGHTSSGSQPLTTNADSAKWDLLVDAASATSSAAAAATSETNAATSETNAAASAATALTHKNDAETAKTASETAQTAAETARTAAQTAQAAAEAALDNFDDRFLGAKTSDPSLDNDGNALTDGALYFDTTLNVMKVYDLGATVWRKIQLTSTDQANLNTVAAQISPTNNLATVAGLNTEITNLAGITTEITNLNGIRTDISGVNTIAADVTAVKNNETNITAVKNNETNINTLAGISGLSSLAAAHAAVTNVNNNLISVQNFADVYRISSSAPTTSLNQGDLYFDTTANELKVYKSSGWAAAGSTVNGTANRFEYTATAGQTTFSGADNNSSILAYDSGFIDIYLNGVKLANADFTATSGTSIVLATAAAANDILMIVAYGTFQLANISVNDLVDTPSAIGSAGQTLVVNSGGTALEYSTPTVTTSINDLTDTPSSIGLAGQALVVNGAGNALIYSNASSAEVYGLEMYYNPSTINITVTFQNVGGANKYFINGVQQDTLELFEGNTYIFDWSAASSHPLRFSTTSGGTHNSGVEYTNGVTVDMTNYKTTIVVANAAPTLYYYCQYHPNMGGQANTPVPADNSVRVTTTNQGADNISGAEFDAFDDVLFSASGFVFSLNADGRLIATV